jgi:hypothetical protein
MKKIVYYSLIALLGITFYACQDFLVAENKSAGTNSDQYFATETGLKAFLATAYSKLKPLATNTNVNEWGTDLYIAVYGNDPGDIHRFTLTAEDGQVKSYYTSAYSLINDANGVILYSGGKGASADEARFLRNYGYYLLTQQFGDVPYITDYINSANRNYPRVKVETIYNSMIAELEALATSTNLPEKSEGANLGRASKRAVAALLAKVYLAAGWDLQTTLGDAALGTYTVNSTAYFQKAAEWADAAINGQALTMSFASKWSAFNENNAEEIFSVQYNRSGYPGDLLKGGHGLQNTFGHSYGSPSQNGLKSCNSMLAPSAKALYLWDKNDDRWNGTFMNIMYNAHKGADGKPVWGTEGYYAYYNNPNPASLNIVLAYFPYYTDKDTVLAWINANKSRFVSEGFANKTGRAFIMSDPMLRIEINELGAITSQQTISYKEGSKTVLNSSVTVKKWDDPATEQESSTTTCYRDILLFHLSDMYLVAAEAYLMAGDAVTALSRVNAVRTRSHAVALNSFGDYVEKYASSVAFGDLKPLDVILDEKARELFGENESRWTDLRRTKQLVRYNLSFNEFVTTVAAMSNPKGEIKWLRPIPAAEISSNEGIAPEDQNPGY